jgi:hypothetical protein
MSNLRHVDSRSLCASRLNGYRPECLALESNTGQQALAGFVTETCIEVAALRTTGCRTQAISFVTADHTKEELLPFHVLRVAAGQQGKVPEHEPRQFPAVRKPQILPEVVWPSGSTRDENRQERSVRIRDGAKAPQQLPQASLIVVHHWLAIQTESFHSFLGAREVSRDNPPEFRTTEAESIGKRKSALALAYPHSKKTCKHMAIEGITPSGRVRLPKVDV